MQEYSIANELLAEKPFKWLCYPVVSDALYVQHSAGTKTSKPGAPLVLQSPGFKGTKNSGIHV